MSTKYLLPCSCGLHVPIDVGQAGQMVACKCGESIEVPTMRQIRQLEKLEEADPQQNTPWTRTQGILFAAGLGFAILFLFVAWYFWNHYRGVKSITKNELTPEQVQIANAHIEKMTVSQTWELWQDEIIQKGLGQWSEPDHLKAAKFARIYFYCLLTFVLAAVLSMAIGFSALWLKPRQATRA